MRGNVLKFGIAILLFALTCSGLGQEQEAEVAQFFNPDDAQKLQELATKTTRLGLAYAYLDPNLVLQELEDMEKYLVKAKGPAARNPLIKIDFDDFRNTLALMTLYPRAEFQVLDDFKSEATPLLAKSKRPNHRVATWFLGLKETVIEFDHTQSRYYLEQARKEIESHPSVIYPVHKFSLETFQIQQELAEGKKFSREQMESAFEKAWSHLEGYNPNDDWASGLSWANGRYATLFWIHQMSKFEGQDTKVTPVILSYFGKWSSNPKLKSTNDFEKNLERVQGYIIFTLTAIDTVLVAQEENLDYLTKAGNKSLFQSTQMLFDSLDLQTNQIQSALELPESPTLNLAGSAFITELRVRAEVLAALDPSLDSETRQSSALALSGRVDNLPLAESVILNHLRLGKVFLELGLNDSAVDSWEKAFKKAEDSGYRNLASEASRLLTPELARQKKWKKASFYGTQISKNLLYEIANTDLEEIAKLALQASNDEAQAYLNSSDPKNALVALDRRDQMKAAAMKLRADPEALTAAKSLSKSEKKVASLQKSVNELKTVPQSETRDQLLADAEKLLAQSRGEFLTQSRKIRAQFPNLYTSTLRFDPLNLAEVQKSLGPGIAVVQYFPTESELYIFVVDREQFRLRSMSVGDQRIEKLVSSFYTSLLRQARDESKFARELYDLLISPIELDIKEAQNLVLIPSGKLNILPFGALLNESGQRLTEQKSLAELAKTTDFIRIANTKAEAIENVVAFTNATLDLPATDEEGRSIVGLFPGSQQYRGAEASKQNLITHGTGKDVLHLATHGISDVGDSLKNHLRLANEERLGQEEIFNLDLTQTSIVTLSACNTALGDGEVNGFVASLAEAFWIAGSPTVVASLWPVEDESTQILMTEFYSGMKAGLGRAESLRRAQQKVMSNPNYTHPFFWSGFVAFGDYR